jgi:hypothetical protein
MRVAMIQRDDAGDIRAAALYERAHEPGLDDDELMRALPITTRFRRSSWRRWLLD